MRVLHYIMLSLILLFSLSLKGQQYNGSQQDFSVSKPIYKTHNWQNLEFDEFRIHFYGFNEAQAQAEQIAIETDKTLKRIEQYFDTDLSHKADIIMFNSYHDYYYSNINEVTIDEENIGGEATINRYTTSIYNTGNQQELFIQLREGIAEIALKNIFYGGGWKDALKNNTLLDFPAWYFEGLKSYLAEEWNNEIDNSVRVGILSGDYKKYHQLNDNEAKYAGHAIWKYIADFYGDNVIPNIVYLTRISTNIESGFAYVLGANLSILSSDFYNHYYQIYSSEVFAKNEIKGEQIELKIKRNSEVLNYTISPDKKKAAFISKKDGKFYWMLHGREKDNYKKIAKTGYKYIESTKDFAPVIAWHPQSEAVIFFYNKKGKTYADLVETDGETTTKEIQEIEMVTSANYNKDGKLLVISATIEGQSDIFTYSFIGNTANNLTNDIYSDVSPSFLADENRVVYSSIREDGKTDIYQVNLSTKAKEQLTFTPNINEKKPLAYGNQFTYLADENGIYNRYRAEQDSIISFVDTTVHYRYFTRTQLLSSYPYNGTSYQKVSDNVYMMGFDSPSGQQFYFIDAQQDDTLNKADISVSYFEQVRQIKAAKQKQNKLKKQGKTTTKGDIKYEKEVVDFTEQKTSKKSSETVKEDQLKMPSTQFYEKEFAITRIVSQLDHSFLNKNYQIFNPLGYTNPGINITLNFEMKDLFNNRSVVGGIRIPLHFRSNEQFIEYQNKEGKLNKGYALQRSAFRQTMGTIERQFLTRAQTYVGKYWVEKPFSPISKLQFSLGGRYDLIALLGEQVGDNNINPAGTVFAPNFANYQLTAKAEYIINNTYSPATNVRYGFRGKVYAEAYQNLINYDGNTFVFGTDLRHYQKIHRGIVWANRLTINGSLGTDRVIYYLGGQDNWFLPKFNEEIALPDEGRYIFQSIATPMRGFIYNSRNGTNFAVFNSEFRVPLIKYFSVEPLRSEFLEHFQIIGFGDVGSAWTGLHPYSNTNSFNEKIIREKPLTIRIKNTQEPLLYGYGFGVRSKVFGYYLRFDWSWGIDDGVTNSVKYFTISLDF